MAHPNAALPSATWRYRGQEISGGKQAGLSDYWRWVLSVYGPEVLDKFGTFRFLLTDLVPCEDAYTNERSLADRVVPLVRADDLWLADRNFCTGRSCWRSWPGRPAS